MNEAYSSFRYPKFVRAIKSRLSPLWWYGFVQFCVGRIVDIINIYIGIFLLPSVISSDDLGAIVPLTNIIAFAGIPMAAALNVTIRFFNTFSVRGEKGHIKALIRDSRLLALILSLILIIVFFLIAPFIQVRLKIENPWVIRILAAILILSCWQPVASATVQGLMRFRSMILSSLVGSIVKLVFMITLIYSFHLAGYLTACLASMTAYVVFLFASVNNYMKPEIKAVSYRAYWPEMKLYFRHAVFMGIIFGFCEVIEPLVIRNFTSRMDSAGYYMAVTFGGIPFFASSALIPFLFSLASERFEKGQRTSGMLLQSTLGILAFGGLFVVILACFGRNILELRKAWAIYADYAPLIWRVGIITTLHGIIMSYMTHENACKRFRYIRFFVPMIILEIVILYSFMGWGFFQPYLPASLWTRINDIIIPHRLMFAIGVIMTSRVILTLYTLVHIVIMHKTKTITAEETGRIIC